jgi:FkbM family methyltransferase
VLSCNYAKRSADAMKISNFVVIDSEYGRFIVNRHCAYQAESLIKTGRPHIQDELQKILTLIGQLPNDCVVVDAGANIGLVSIPVAQALVSKGGIVHAFEPQRLLSYALAGAVALNDLENLVVHHKGLGAFTGKLGLPKVDYAKPQDFGQLSLLDSKSDATDVVNVVTLDSLSLPRLDFLKIDVEGMEVDVLKGGRATIRRDLPFAWIEYWKSDVNEIKAQFAGIEYKFYIMDRLNMLCAPTTKSVEYGLTIQAEEA